jgi:transposase-like protein
MSGELPTINLSALAKHFSDEADAYKLVESIRWPNGPICPHCGTVNEATYLEPKGEGRKTRSGKVSARRVWKCRVKGCSKQFSVTIGTIFERSHISLDKWLLATYLMCSNKNGVSAHELHRELGVTYQSAWFMCHRIREAMTLEPLRSMLTGTVQADETYMGGKQGNRHKSIRFSDDPPKPKTPVLSLLHPESGEVRSQVVPNVRRDTLLEAIQRQVPLSGTTLHTDDAEAYTRIGWKAFKHETVNHTGSEYVRGHVTTNHVEGFFSQLKRGIDGTYHHVSEEHLQRYLTEFDYRYSTRKVSDSERTLRLIRQTAGKRLTYRQPTDG